MLRRVRLVFVGGKLGFLPEVSLFCALDDSLPIFYIVGIFILQTLQLNFPILGMVGVPLNYLLLSGLTVCRIIGIFVCLPFALGLAPIRIVGIPFLVVFATGFEFPLAKLGVSGILPSPVGIAFVSSPRALWSRGADKVRDGNKASGPDFLKCPEG